MRECLELVSPVTMAVKSALRSGGGDSHCPALLLNAGCISVSEASCIKFLWISIPFQAFRPPRSITCSPPRPLDVRLVDGWDWMYPHSGTMHEWFLIHCQLIKWWESAGELCNSLSALSPKEKVRPKYPNMCDNRQISWFNKKYVTQGKLCILFFPPLNAVWKRKGTE